MPRLTAAEVIELLRLAPLPQEGGYFRRVWESGEQAVVAGKVPDAGESRSLATSIYYLLTPSDFSAMHQVASDELWHFYAGDVIQQLRLYPDGRGEIVRLGSRLEKGELPLGVVPGGVWQGTALVPGGQWALVGCTVSPGFVDADYTHGDGKALAKAYPEFSQMIDQLSRS